jgi:choline dehydrogenase-like flavoprotein
LKVLDLHRFEPNSVLEADLCIIGSGPAGLSIANEFVGTYTRVLVLESGGLDEEPDTQALYEIENTGAPRTLKQDTLRYRILGGTSHIWTGRCAPFDASDFERRCWIPQSGWPVTRAELEPYFDRVSPYLGIGPNQFDETLWQRFGVEPPSPPLANPALRQQFWQFSERPFVREPMRFGKDWVSADAPNIEILLHANVTHLNLGPDGKQFESVEVSTLDGRRSLVKAKATVLCCGAIENARLLLASNRVFARGVGNQNDMVGRYLMDHTSVRIGRFDPRRSDGLRSRFGLYWLDDARGRHLYLHGLALTDEVQEKEQLLNCHAYIGDFISPEANPWAGLSRLTSSLKSGRISGPDAKLVLGHLGEIVGGLLRRRFKHRPQLGCLESVWLELILEQIPDPESRVTLSANKKDALGMPLSSLHWKISDTERVTAKRMVSLVCDELKRLGLAPPQDIQQMDTFEEWVALCYERAHPTGTTRMAANPKEGVVDANCQVHDVAGLFIAGSSIFPTTGAANPTMMIVATALRLADHLRANALRSPAVITAATASLQEVL